MPNLNLELNSLPTGLEQEIISRVVKADRRSLKERLVIFSSLVVASVTAIIPASLWLYSDAKTSGFTSYLSLITSDFDTITSSLKEFSLSLLESLPTRSLALALVVFVVLAWSLVSFAFTLHRYRGRRVRLTQI